MRSFYTRQRSPRAGRGPSPIDLKGVAVDLVVGTESHRGWTLVSAKGELTCIHPRCSPRRSPVPLRERALR